MPRVVHRAVLYNLPNSLETGRVHCPFFSRGGTPSVRTVLAWVRYTAYNLSSNTKSRLGASYPSGYLCSTQIIKYQKLGLFRPTARLDQQRVAPHATCKLLPLSLAVTRHSSVFRPTARPRPDRPPAPRRQHTFTPNSSATMSRWCQNAAAFSARMK